ncbi:hypothetical protein BED47_00680 [Gottfriedia luciferensis]|uniref:SEFIR domain-containing protein n=2 Tax=Gottfriedia luciferensis TaxID=178774 RepID=A0ABX2ZXF1_9BACI|nr:hypothetical protein BED47_00680 [Gottfriedia luciferensis]
MEESGINVTLDKWDLKDGQDVYAFMESMVTSQDINKVLVICDEGYQKKADDRSGGVGTETQIITPQIYKDAKQEKFIPIVAQRNEDGNTFLPTYMAGRKYIDLSNSDTYEDNYELLVRNIYEAPLHQRPTRGKPPEYLFENAANSSKTTKVIRQMENAIDKTPRRLTYLASEFIDAFVESLEQFKIRVEEINDEIDEIILSRIDSMTPFRDSFIKVLKLLIEAEKLDVDFIVEFYEKVYPFTSNSESGTYNILQFDHYKFFIHELFLYTVATLVKYKEYDILSDVLNSDFNDLSYIASDKPLSYFSFRLHLQSLEIRKERLNSTRISIQSDILKHRAKDFTEIFNADMLLYYLSKLNDRMDSRWGWFPITYIYQNQAKSFKIISKLKSKRHFEAVKGLFGQNSAVLLGEKFIDFRTDRGFSHDVFNDIPNINNYINPALICTLP